MTTEAREGAPRFFLCHHQSVILVRKSPPPLLFFFFPSSPPCFPYFNSDSSPVERIAEASLRSSTDVKLWRKEVGKPQFHQHFTDAPRKRCTRFVSAREWMCVSTCVCVCVRARGGLLLWRREEGGADGLRGHWLRDGPERSNTQHRHGGGGKTHMDA